MDPKTRETCSGNGNCECAKCECDSGFEGDFHQDDHEDDDSSDDGFDADDSDDDGDDDDDQDEDGNPTSILEEPAFRKVVPKEKESLP